MKPVILPNAPNPRQRISIDLLALYNEAATVVAVHLTNSRSIGVQAIAAVASNGVIGQAGRLPWSIAADWQHFMRLTEGGVLIMGRTSFEDMLNEPLWAESEREYCVVSRDVRFAQKGPVKVLSSPQAALEAAMAIQKPVWICGGSGVYRQLMSACERLWLTLIKAEFNGDTFFPEWQTTFPHCRVIADGEENGLQFQFTVWSRVQNQ
jgi:dihydrofolate reductase